jgi:hypothetical protein
MIWLIPILLLVVSGCQPTPQERHYTEVVIQAPERPMAVNPHDGMDMSSMATSDMDIPTVMNTNYSWVAPFGWKQSPGKGMRLASFHLSEDKDAIDCSVISLAGMAGGLEANLRRWMGQIGLENLDLAGLISSASTIKIKSGQEAKVFDFTTIQGAVKPSDKSLVVVMLAADDATLFIKMTGSMENVKKHKADFFKLVQSIEPK